MTWSDATTVANLIAAGAGLVSLLAFVVSLLAWRTSRRATDIAARAEEYDYAIRLQVRDEQSQVLNGPEDMFRYSAKLINGGLKPVRIDRVFVDYGGDTRETSWHAEIDGLSDVPPGGDRPVNFRLRKNDYESTLSKFGLEKCFVRLRVRYFNLAGAVEEAERPLIVLGPGRATTFYSQRDEALT